MTAVNNIYRLPAQNPVRVLGVPPDYKGACSHCSHRTDGYVFRTDDDDYNHVWEDIYVCNMPKIYSSRKDHSICTDVNPNDTCGMWQQTRWASLGKWFRHLAD